MNDGEFLDAQVGDEIVESAAVAANQYSWHRRERLSAMVSGAGFVGLLGFEPSPPPKKKDVEAEVDQHLQNARLTFDMG